MSSLSPITIPHYITREFIQLNKNYNFLYSTALNAPFYQGQCNVAEGLQNAFPLPVRWSQCKSSGYFTDNQMDEIVEAIDYWLMMVPREKPIIPFRKIGHGASRMFEFAPKCWLYLHNEINKIKYGNIVYQ